MIEDFYKLEPYDLDKTEKNEMLTSELVRLTREHGEKCQEYGWLPGRKCEYHSGYSVLSSENVQGI